MNDSFSTRTSLEVNGQRYTIASLAKLGERYDLKRLPFSMKILLENLLRHEDGVNVTRKEIEAVANWEATKEPDTEIAFMPARVVLQDFTGVPCVVDLAAMRDAVVKLGGEASQINPQIPSELVIDHSVQVDVFGKPEALDLNGKIEFGRNIERYSFLRWGQSAFDNFKVVPPNTGIVHQVNLENLARVVMTRKTGNETWAFPDTAFGTDSHTTMINGIGVLGWGVGGIEAEAAMLGQPSSMLIPQVVGFKLHGKLPEGATATDLVLTVTQMLRKHGVVGKFVEFFGDGLDHLALADRATIANMAPEYGATCGIFPIDGEALNYLRLSGRDDALIALVEAYAKAQGLARTRPGRRGIQLDPAARPRRREAVAGRSEASAGPRAARERRRQLPRSAGADGRCARDQDQVADAGLGPGRQGRQRVHLEGWRGRHRRDHLLHQHLQPGRHARRRPARAQRRGQGAQGRAVGQDLARTGLARRHRLPQEGRRADRSRAARLYVVGYGCTTCIGNSGPLPEEVSAGIAEGDLVVTSVLSGNRNFEGRVHPEVKMNYLASPPLVVAYAIAGTVDVDLSKDPIGHDATGKAVFLRDIWPSNKEIGDVIAATVGPRCSRRTTPTCSRATAAGTRSSRRKAASTAGTARRPTSRTRPTSTA